MEVVEPFLLTLMHRQAREDPWRFPHPPHYQTIRIYRQSEPLSERFLPLAHILRPFYVSGRNLQDTSSSMSYTSSMAYIARISRDSKYSLHKATSTVDVKNRVLAMLIADLFSDISMRPVFSINTKHITPKQDYPVFHNSDAFSKSFGSYVRSLQIGNHVFILGNYMLYSYASPFR